MHMLEFISRLDEGLEAHVTHRNKVAVLMCLTSDTGTQPPREGEMKTKGMVASEQSALPKLIYPVTGISISSLLLPFGEI